MTNSNSSSDSGWVDCQGGEIAGMVQTLNHQQAVSARTQNVKLFALAASLFLMVGLGWMMFPGNKTMSEVYYGGVSCTDVIKNSKPYVLQELEPELANRIKIHLGKCEHCNGKLTMLREKMGLSSSAKNEKNPDDQVVLLMPSTIAVTDLTK